MKFNLLPNPEGKTITLTDPETGTFTMSVETFLMMGSPATLNIYVEEADNTFMAIELGDEYAVDYETRSFGGIELMDTFDLENVTYKQIIPNERFSMTVFQAV